jgi:hypothetical protein
VTSITGVSKVLSPLELRVVEHAYDKQILSLLYEVERWVFINRKALCTPKWVGTERMGISFLMAQNCFLNTYNALPLPFSLRTKFCTSHIQHTSYFTADLIIIIMSYYVEIRNLDQHYVMFSAPMLQPLSQVQLFSLECCSQIIISIFFFPWDR